MKRKKIFGICVLLCAIGACAALLFLPINRTSKTTTRTYQERSGKYLRLSGNVYVNAENFPDLPTLYKGDKLEIEYYLSNVRFGLHGGTYLNDIVNIKKLYGVDWGVSFEPFQVSPIGIQIRTVVDSKASRVLAISGYRLDISLKNQWQPVPLLTQDSSFAPISFVDGSTVELRWKSLYGTLEPGLYRLCATVSCEGESRNFEKTFTISKPVPTTLEDAVEQSVQYFLTKEIVDPPEKNHSDDFERITQSGEAGVWSEPIAGFSFDQIAYSYEIYEYEQVGGLHIYKIIGMCRSYNNQIPVREFGAPIWLTIQQQDASTFDIVSFKMPYRITWDRSCPRFPPNARGHVWLLEEFRDKHRAACDAQVVGGVSMPPIEGFYYFALHEDSSEANEILKAIASGKKVSAPDKIRVDYTILIGDQIYYVIDSWVDATETYIYTLYSVADDTYTQLVGDDYKVLNRIYNYPSTNRIESIS